MLLEEGVAGASVYRYGSSERYWLDEPVHVGELPEGIRAKLGTHTVPQPFVFDYSDVELVGPAALPITADGRYLLEPLLGSSHRLVNAVAETVAGGSVPVRSRLLSPADRIEASLFPLVGPWCTDFFHWFADYLPRLQLLEHYESETGRIPDLLVPADPPTWLTESLDFLDIPQSRRRQWTGRRTQVSRLVVGSVPRHTETTTDTGGYIHSPCALNRLARRLRTAVGVENSDHGPRLYVSRADAADRRIVNEDELLDVAEEFGFEKIQPEQLSFSDQVAAFSSAKVVLGPHGAGLLNVIYADDPTLVELFGAYQNPCFFAIAGGMGIDYATTLCNAVGDDLEIDPDAVGQLLETVVGSRETR